MLHELKGVIHLADSGNESVGSDMEEIDQWDKKLCEKKTFQMAVTILTGCRFDSPSLELQQKILLDFVGQPACNYFWSSSPQALAFKNLKVIIELGWKTGRWRGCRKRNGTHASLWSI